MTLRLTDVAGEAVLLAGGGRAILLQIANPAVGAGVARHSDFSSNPLRRLRHTLSYVYVVAFGTEEEVRRARGFVGRAHAPVHSASAKSGQAAESPPYNAYDPELQLWVAATLYETAATVHATVYGPPSSADAERLYRDYQVLGTSLQVPQELWPESLADFRAYWDREIASLSVDDETRAVARQVLHPVSAPLWLRAAMPIARLATAGFLPSELREAFELPWDARRARRFERLLRMTTAVYPKLPSWLRHWPMRHYLAEFRKLIAREAG